VTGGKERSAALDLPADFIVGMVTQSVLGDTEQLEHFSIIFQHQLTVISRTTLLESVSSLGKSSRGKMSQGSYRVNAQYLQFACFFRHAIWEFVEDGWTKQFQRYLDANVMPQRCSHPVAGAAG